MISMALSMPRTRVVDQAAQGSLMDEAAFRCLYHRTARPLRAYLVAVVEIWRWPTICCRSHT